MIIPVVVPVGMEILVCHVNLLHRPVPASVTVLCIVRIAVLVPLVKAVIHPGIWEHHVIKIVLGFAHLTTNAEQALSATHILLNVVQS